MSAETTTAKALLVGLDGATFSILDPLMEQGVMPFLKSFIEEGVRAELRTIVPALTPPAWTSLLTGRTPGHHGILDFFQLEAPGSKRIRLTTSRDRRCRTIADIVNHHGLQATILNFPAHFPPPPINGVVMAGWMPWRQLRLGCYPEGLYDQLKMLPGFNPRELTMDMELEASATEGASEEEYIAWVEMHARREEHWLEVLRYLMRTQPAEFTAILFDGPDKVQHLCWRFLDPELATGLTAEEQVIRLAALDFYRRLDRVLAEVVAAAGPETTVVFASDHGFGATNEVFHINSWLAQFGYLTWSDAALNDNSFTNANGLLGMNRLTRHTAWLDWSRTRAYCATPTSNGIHIVMADEGREDGVQQAHYQQFRSELCACLRRFKDPVSGEPVVVDVWKREEIYAGEAAAYAPDLTLGLRDGGLVSILPSDEILKPRIQPAGTHRPVGVFFARGPGILRGRTVAELSILDMAPLLLYVLGLGIPEELEGRVPLEIFEAAFRAKHRVEITPTLVGTQAVPSDGEPGAAKPSYDGEAEAAILSRLRALGYVE